VLVYTCVNKCIVVLYTVIVTSLPLGLIATNHASDRNHRHHCKPPVPTVVKTLKHRHTELQRDQMCHIEPVQVRMTELCQTSVVFPRKGPHRFMTEGGSYE